MDLSALLQKRILLLDGGMGTMIQKYGFREEDFRGRRFITHSKPLSGFNDILNFSKPDYIRKIHESYLQGGADIISTNTFNANTISLGDYGFDQIDEMVYNLNFTGARIAKESIKEFETAHPSRRPHFVAGSLGPTNRSASLSPDISDPIKRNISFRQLFSSYYIQAKGLIEGGVDLLLFETCFDTLNLKAGLAAANAIMRQNGKTIPIMVSATPSDKAGHLLSGQNLEAFIISIKDYDNVISIGLNCGFGPDDMLQFIETLSACSNHYISCHPNAGLPDNLGCYNITPEDFKRNVYSLLQTGKINIIGGCCGTTPQHIAAIKDIVDSFYPYHPGVGNPSLKLAGTEPLILDSKNKMLVIGERCNVAGSRKFLRLINEKKIDEAAEIAKKEIIQGAKVIDINMDDPLLDSREEMIKFIRYINSEPEISTVPYMIDSSRWDVIEGALENIQGKGIVNSLSLKEGEELFIQRAIKVRQFGFALVVMAFDEKGQADTYERKIEICGRAYKILTEQCGFKPEDIIFDVNVMAIATGMPEHADYALDFIKAVDWIKKNIPGVKTSGGVSNLSFSFRGKNRIRKHLHAVFLKHALEAGLDMAIINPASQMNYQEIPEDVRSLMEEVILNTNPESEEKLINLVLAEEKKKNEKRPLEANNRPEDIKERLQEDMIKGDLLNLESDLKEAILQCPNPLELIEGPLMEGMKTVGSLFGEGKMYLPQVVKTARAMNSAVEFLKPFFHQNGVNQLQRKTGKIIIATVKGDVHDIGKNIVATVLACNNFEVLDLGVMVEKEEIVKRIKEEKADILCLSGLITPSLLEMVRVIELMEKEGINIPVMVGGAATSPLHTLLKIKPSYSGVVLHMKDASQNPVAARNLLDPNIKNSFLEDLEFNNHKILENYNNDLAELVPFDIAISKRDKTLKEHDIISPESEIGKNIIINLQLEEIIPFINWKMLFGAWKLQGEYLNNFPYSLTLRDIDVWRKQIKDSSLEKAEEALELYKTSISLIKEMENSGLFNGKASVRFEQAWSDEKNIYTSHHTFPMLRQQAADSSYLSCSDFIAEKGKNDIIGFFAVTAGNCWSKAAQRYFEEGDTYKSILLQSIADRIAEAASEWFHKEVRIKYWGYASDENLTVSEIIQGKYQGIRPAWGYPMLPDQLMLLETIHFIPYAKLGIKLTENGGMSPSSSVSGIYISNPKSRYFMVGKIGEDQKKDYERRKI